MARPQQTNVAVNRGLFKDIYDECCKNDAEKMILDIIISQFILDEVFKGSPATERAVAKVTGLSKSGVRVVEGRAMEKLKKHLMKQGIRKTDDVINTTSGRTAVGSGGVDEKEKVNESTKDLRSMTRAEFIDHLDDIAEYLDYVLQGDDYEEREELIDKFGDIIVELKDYKGWAK